MSKKSDVSLQTLAEFMRDLVYDDFSRNLRWSLSCLLYTSPSPRDTR